MNLKKKLLTIKCLKIRLNKPLKLFFNLIRLIFCTYYRFSISCNKHANVFHYALDSYCIFDIL